MISMDMSLAPKDKNILIQTKLFHFHNWTEGFVEAGTQWVECWWKESEERFVEFCGNYETSTTNEIHPLAWAELPS